MSGSAAPPSPWKGKAREDLDVLSEFNPVITYRHLLSSSLGVRNPLRVCGLTDMDAFYAACEQKRLGLDSDMPLVVRQWDALIAVNYPARKYGISRMEKVKTALELCPHLRVVHVATFDPSVPDAKPIYTDNPDSRTHKVSLDYYRKESKKIMDLFKEMLPGAEVERASIDEAFIDFTDPVRKEILASFPHLATPPPEGLDTPLPPPSSDGVPVSYPPSRRNLMIGIPNVWRDLGHVIPISGRPPEPSQSKPEASKGVLPNDSFSPSRKRESTAEETSGQFEYGPNGRSGSAELEDIGEESEEGSLADKHFENATDVVVRDGSDSPLTWHDIALSIAASMLLRMRDEVKNRFGYTTSAGLARNKFLAKLVASYKKRDSQSILRNAAIPNFLRPLPFQKIRFLGGKLGRAIAQEYEAQTVGDLLDISIEEMQRKLGENSIWVWEILRGIDRSEVKEKPPVPKSMGASKNLQQPVTHPSHGAHWLRILAGELAFRLVEAREENPGLWPKTLVLHITESYHSSRSKQGPFPFSRNPNIDYICKLAEKLWSELVGTAVEFDKNKAKGLAVPMKVTNVFLGFSGVEVMAASQKSIEGFFTGASASEKRKAVMMTADQESRRSKKQARDAGGSGASTVVSYHCERCSRLLREEVQAIEDRDIILERLKTEHDDFHFAQDLAKQDGMILPGSGSKRATKKKSKKESKGIAKFFRPVPSKSSRQ